MIKVLCVDDENFILKILEETLSKFSLKVITTTDPLFGLELLKRNPIDIIITDYKMPEMNGIVFLKLSRQIAPDAFRIMLTGVSSSSVTIAAINDGEIHKYITKPWGINEFHAIIKEAIAKIKILKSTHYMDSEKISNEITKIRNVLKSMNFSTIKALSKTIEIKDKYTKGHCERVMNYSLNLGMKIGLKSIQLEQLKYAATLHDIGKIGVQAQILNKPGKLSLAERKLIEKHPVDGARIMAEIDFLTVSSRIIREHHERINGKGYPDKKNGNELLIESKILSISDVYDALVSDRAYRTAMPDFKAKSILIEEKGKMFDPDLVDVFISEVL